MPTRKLPPDMDVVKLYEGGMSYAAIAAKYDVVKSAVAYAIQRAGHEGRNESSGYMPPGLVPIHYGAPAARNLRSLARREKGGRPLSDRESFRLDNWLEMLRTNDLVVAYDPELPASRDNAAAPSHGGWHYIKRPEGLPKAKITAYDPV